MTDIEAKLRLELLGSPCNGWRLLAGGTLILVFLNGKVRLWMDCAWRVSSQEGVIAASLDSAELILSRLGILKDLVVEEIDVAPGCWDLKLTLSNGTLIEGFCHSLEDEMWELRRADGLRLGIGPGLKVEERYEAED